MTRARERDREKSEKWRQEGFKIVRKAISKFKIKIRNLFVPIGLPIRLSEYLTMNLGP